MRVVCIRAEEAELAAWKKAVEQASAKAGAKLSLSQWVRGRLNEAARQEKKRSGR
jgi:hypothetical protein